MTGINASVRAYETWLEAQLGQDFVAEDIEKKHRKMRKNSFVFLRATYWRWAETILETCPELKDAPQVLAIGDTHLENFGTWRDAEARLIWGANDFDDAAVMPYPLDIVRLAASAVLSRHDGGPSAREICGAILDGYAAGLTEPGPLVLERDHEWLRKAVVLPEEDRTEFWHEAFAPAPSVAPLRYQDALRDAMPDSGMPFVVSRRSAGTGSLGRPRFRAHGEWRGGPIMREAKAVVASAWSLRHAPGPFVIRAGEIAAGRFRAPDPHYRVSDAIVTRRLSPNSRKPEVKGHADTLLDPKMLDLMGREVANCHAADPDCLPALQDDLSRRGDEWLHRTAKAAAHGVEQDKADFA